MRMMFCLISFLMSFSLFAQTAEQSTVRTTINQIYEPSAHDPDYLILANNGYVYGIEARDENFARIAREALASSLVIELELREQDPAEKEKNQRFTVDDITILENINSAEVPYRGEELERGIETDAFLEPEHHIKPLDGYRLTSLSSGGNRSLFSSMRNDLSGSSECYNRAHVWSWEIYQRYRYNTGKMFLFFTRKYISEYRYKWWFHVAPFINQTSSAQHMVLDRQYTRGPLPMHSWTDVFMRNDAHCPVVDRYSSYSQNQYSRYCYLIPASMYYWQPYNLDRLERYHTTKKVFIQSQINHAYRDARR